MGCEKISKVDNEETESTEAKNSNADSKENKGSDVYEIIGMSNYFKKLNDKMEEAASNDEALLILGPRGSGKENIAQNIHKKSKRQKGQLVSINCAGIPEGLFESLVFGIVKGAAPDITTTMGGYIASAEKKTLFLDEIGDLSLFHQAELLRFLNDKKYSRVGEEELREADVRIIAATNKDLEKQIEKGEFRADLYDRLSFQIIQTENLSKYPEDVICILNNYVNRENINLDPRSKFLLYFYDFPGNLRELRSLIRKDFNEILEIVKGRVEKLKNKNLEIIRKAIEETELMEKYRGQIQKYGKDGFLKNTRNKDEKSEILENLQETLERMEDITLKHFGKALNDSQVLSLHDAIEFLEEGPTKLDTIDEQDEYTDEFGDLSKYNFSQEDYKDLEVLREGNDTAAIREIVLKHKHKFNKREDEEFVIYRKLLEKRRKAINERDNVILSHRLNIYEIAILKQCGISNISALLNIRDENVSREDFTIYSILPLKTPLDVFPEPIDDEEWNRKFLPLLD